MLSVFLLLRFFSVAHCVLLRQGPPPEPSQRSTGRPYRQVLRNVDNSHYVANFTIGGQAQLGIFDNNRASLLVRSASVGSLGSSYDHSKSSSYEAGDGKDLEMQFGVDTVPLTLGYDTVALSEGLRAKHQAIYEITKHTMVAGKISKTGIHDIQMSTFSAVIGLGSDHASRSDEGNRSEQTKPRGLLTNLEIDAFAVCYEKEGGANGYLSWGVAPGTLKREHKIHAKTIGRHSWTLPMRNAYFTEPPKADNTLVSSPCGGEKGCAAIFDMSMSLIAAPTWHLWELGRQLGMMKDDCSDLDKLPTLKFEIDGHQLELPPEAYMIRLKVMSIEADSIWDLLWFKPKLRKAVTCMPLFIDSQLTSEHGPVWIFGAPFFRYFHTTFDRKNKEVIFAKAGDDCQPEPLKQSGSGKESRTGSLFEARPNSKVSGPLEVSAGSVIINPLLLPKHRGRQDADATQIEL